MRNSIYVLAFLLPLKGALAVCPEPNILTPEILKQIQDRLKNDEKDLQLPPINYIKYKVIRGTNAANNYSMLSNTPHITPLPSPAPGMCAYSASNSEKEDSEKSEKDMVFILQPAV